MRVAMCQAYGPPENVALAELPSPALGPGEVRVNVLAAAVNFPDVLSVADRYQVRTPVPFVPGSEFAGEVADAGDGRSGLAVGDRVFGSVGTGAFAEELAVPGDGLLRVPTGVDIREAAGFNVVYGTAYNALRAAGAQPGEWVVVLGAAGGVGLAAVEVAREMGCRVLAAASSTAKLELCAAKGAEAVVNYTTDNLRDAIRAATGTGAHVVIDPVGGSFAEPALRACRPGSRYVTIGYASGEIPRIPLNLVLLKGVTVLGFVMGTFSLFQPEAAAEAREELLDLFARGRLRPHISSVYPLAETAAALRELADRRALGKVVVDVAG